VPSRADIENKPFKERKFMRIYKLAKPRHFQLENQPEPEINDHEVLVKVCCCGVCMSEVDLWEGKRVGAVFPAFPGHEISGIVEKVGKAVDQVIVGDRVIVYNYGGFAEYCKTLGSEAIKIPEQISLEEAATAEPLGCAVAAGWRSRIKIGDRVGVVGAGYMGALMIQIALLQGALEVVSLDIRPEAFETAKRAGATGFLNPKDAAAGLKELALDVVIETAGVEAAINTAIEAIKIGGTVVIFGFHQGAGRTINMQLSNWKGIDLVNAHERSRELKLASMRTGIALLDKGKLKADPFISHRYRFEDVPIAFEDASQKPAGYCKGLVRIHS
jgi:2-desacetyl-2-hydroxyethyl bacteriochlorophyllide A dehydrogenase